MPATSATSSSAIAGMRSRRIAFNAESVDVTDFESAGRWRELLAGAGVQRFAHGGDGRHGKRLRRRGDIILRRGRNVFCIADGHVRRSSIAAHLTDGPFHITGFDGLAIFQPVVERV